MELSDEIYSMNRYSYSGEGIKGILKQNPADFIVFECDPINNIPITKIENDNQNIEGGLFLIGTVEKTNIDHSRMLRDLSKTFKVNENDISTGGIKDAKAITTQLFSVYKPKIIPKDPTMINDRLIISKFKFNRERIFPGSMGGNYFEITIRETNKLVAEKIHDFEHQTKNGILNFFGYQRFGSDRPISAEMGKFLSNGFYEEAIDLLLGKEYRRSRHEFRKLWRETKDPNLILEKSEFIPRIEYQILIHLKSNPKDYRGAIKKIPTFLRNIFTSAFISKLTNHYLSLRGLEGLHSGEREIGKNIEIAQPSQKWNKPLNDLWDTTFEELDTSISDFKNIRHTSRMLKLFYFNWKHSIVNDNTLKVNFRLETGCYATTLLRELMKSQPESYV